MEEDIYIKIANEISDKLISLHQNHKPKKKTFLEIYNELLDKKYQEYHCDILSYIPERLATKGYEIVNSNYFELKKY